MNNDNLANRIRTDALLLHTMMASSTVEWDCLKGKESYSVGMHEVQ